jgi:hypothetical protein
MKTQKTVIATSIALMLLGVSAASASPKPGEYHEDKWNEVTSYGSTSIANDSVSEWGPWSEFAPPAAGAPSVGFVHFDSGELPRPLPQGHTLPPVVPSPPPDVPPPPVVPPLADFCKAGEACGYAVFKNEKSSSVQGGGSPLAFDDGQHPAKMAASIPSTLDQNAKTNPRLSSLDAVTPLFPLSGELGNPVYGTNEDGLLKVSFDRTSGTGPDEGGNGTDEASKIDGTVLDTAPLAYGRIVTSVTKYINGTSTSSQTTSYFVTGIVTSAADMAAVRADTISAVNYSGKNFSGVGDGVSPVAITVNFGPGTWNGSWNGGKDGNVHTETHGGQTYVYGQVGFNASGIVSGSNIASTSVTTLDQNATISGKVVGSFYGSQAQALAGVVDITKSNSTGEYANARHVDLFKTFKVTKD